MSKEMKLKVTKSDNGNYYVFSPDVDIQGYDPLTLWGAIKNFADNLMWRYNVLSDIPWNDLSEELQGQVDFIQDMIDGKEE